MNIEFEQSEKNEVMLKEIEHGECFCFPDGFDEVYFKVKELAICSSNKRSPGKKKGLTRMNLLDCLKFVQACKIEHDLTFVVALNTSCSRILLVPSETLCVPMETTLTVKEMKPLV